MCEVNSGRHRLPRAGGDAAQIPRRTSGTSWAAEQPQGGRCEGDKRGRAVSSSLCSRTHLPAPSTSHPLVTAPAPPTSTLSQRFLGYSRMIIAHCFEVSFQFSILPIEELSLSCLAVAFAVLTCDGCCRRQKISMLLFT